MAIRLFRVNQKKDIKKIKRLIEFAPTIQRANEYIEEFTPYKDTSDKLNFLFQEFDIAIVGNREPVGGYRSDEVRLENDYEVVLSAIIDKKWR